MEVMKIKYRYIIKTLCDVVNVTFLATVVAVELQHDIHYSNETRQNEEAAEPVENRPFWWSSSYIDWDSRS